MGGWTPTHTYPWTPLPAAARVAEGKGLGRARRRWGGGFATETRPSLRDTGDVVGLEYGVLCAVKVMGWG